MRVFVAIDLPENVRESLDSLVAGLRRRLSGVRWVRPQGIHLTLRFIGEAEERDVESLRAALAETVPGCAPPFDLHLRGLGTFPEAGRPRVLWVAVEHEGESLSALQRAVESAAIRAGFAEETRPFNPHLTLGRFDRGGRQPGMGSLLEEFREIGHGSFNVSSVTLFRSLLKPGGAEYHRLEEVGLAGVRP